MTDQEAMALRKFIDAIRAHYAARVHTIGLFGSRARGDARPDSDADLAVVLEDGDWSFWREKVQLADLSYEPFMESGLHIQPWPIARSAWEDPEKHHSPRLIRAIKRDAKVLLEAV